LCKNPTLFQTKCTGNAMEITQQFIQDKYDLAYEKKEILKHIDRIFFRITNYNLNEKYHSVGDFFAQVCDKMEQDFPQLKRVQEHSHRFLKIKMVEDYDGLYIECETYEQQFETDNETIARLIRREKNKMVREKKKQLHAKEKLILYNKLRSELQI